MPSSFYFKVVKGTNHPSCFVFWYLHPWQIRLPKTIIVILIVLLEHYDTFLWYYHLHMIQFFSFIIDTQMYLWLKRFALSTSKFTSIVVIELLLLLSSSIDFPKLLLLLLISCSYIVLWFLNVVEWNTCLLAYLYGVTLLLNFPKIGLNQKSSSTPCFITIILFLIFLLSFFLAFTFHSTL